MGLDVTHGCWHGAYSAFSRWRTKLAEVAGYEVLHMPKIDSNNEYGRPMWDLRLHYPHIMVDWGHITEAHLNGEWDETPADPLMVLIAHYDCDGYIFRAQQQPLIERLKELLPLLDVTEENGHIGNYRTKTEEFIKGLELAYINNETVEFA